MTRRWRRASWVHARDLALLALLLTALQLCWQAFSQGPARSGFPIERSQSILLVYAYVLLLLPPMFARGKATSILAAAAVVGLLMVFVADLTAIKYFGSPFVELYPHLPVTAHTASPDAIVGTAKSYVAPAIWLVGAGAIGIGLLAAHYVTDRATARAWVLALIPAVFAFSAVAKERAFQGDPVIARFIDEPQTPERALVYKQRDHNLGAAAAPVIEPETILMVIVESGGAEVPASDGRTLLTERIIASSGADGWHRFAGAVTSSNATDISVPSLLTGTGANEGADVLHARPLIWQYASERGYRTGFVTSSTLDWAGFAQFLAGGAPDKIVSAADSRLAFINDLTVDDHFAYRTAANMLVRANGKLFLVLYVNALHVPFQAHSAYGLPDSLDDRYSRASAITEAGFRDLFAALRQSGRLDDALIMVAGDHGEIAAAGALPGMPGRLNSFTGGVLSPMFLVKAPRGLPAQNAAALRENSHRLVGNLDLAPTVADLLGFRPGGSLAHLGFSLLRPVPADRMVFAAATNEWRQWPRAALAIAQRDQRLLCDDVTLCRLAIARRGTMISSRPARPTDTLFQAALEDPVMRRNMAQLYREHYR